MSHRHSCRIFSFGYWLVLRVDKSENQYSHPCGHSSPNRERKREIERDYDLQISWRQMSIHKTNTQFSAHWLKPFAGEPLTQQQKYSSSSSPVPPVPPVYPFGRQNSTINIVSHMPCRSHVKQTKKWRKEKSRTHTHATLSPTSLSSQIQIHFALVTSFGTCKCIGFSDPKVLVCHKSTSPNNHQHTHTHALSQSADKFILIRSDFHFSTNAAWCRRLLREFVRLCHPRPFDIFRFLFSFISQSAARALAVSSELYAAVFTLSLLLSFGMCEYIHFHRHRVVYTNIFSPLMYSGGGCRRRRYTVYGLWTLASRADARRKSKRKNVRSHCEDEAHSAGSPWECVLNKRRHARHCRCRRTFSTMSRRHICTFSFAFTLPNGTHQFSFHFVSLCFSSHTYAWHSCTYNTLTYHSAPISSV